jgi:hypothetical protein
VTLSRDKELWAIALWVETNAGDDGDIYISQQMDRLKAQGDLDGVAMWESVWERYEALAGSESAARA